MILSITFSKPTPICFQKFGKPLTKIKIKPVSKGSDISYFAEMFTEKQVFHKNIDASEIEISFRIMQEKLFLTVTTKQKQKKLLFYQTRKGISQKLQKKYLKI